METSSNWFTPLKTVFLTPRTQKESPQGYSPSRASSEPGLGQNQISWREKVWADASGRKQTYWEDVATGWWTCTKPAELRAQPDRAANAGPIVPSPPLPSHKSRLQAAATGLRECEWTMKPDLISLPKALQLFQAGTACTHNMIKIRSLAEFQEFSTYWHAFDKPGNVTVLLAGPAISVSQALLAQKNSVQRQTWP